MNSNGPFLRGILSDLKSRRGATLDDLCRMLPDRYQSLDIDPRYLIFESVAELAELGLVEVYVSNRLLAAKDLAKSNRWDWPQKAKIFISKQAVEIEENLGIRLDSAVNPEALEYTMLGGALNRQWPDVFVLMPFEANLKPVYEDHIRPIGKRLDLSIARADDFFSVHQIMSEIWTAISQASIIIADCTGRNPNVFYEIGIAHSFGKPTILMTQSLDDIPFDLRHFRVVQYRYDPRGMKEFEKTLERTIRHSVGSRSSNEK
jgi:hypothetical protein